MPSSQPMRVPPRIVITGATSGIGAALARHYANERAILGLIARRRAELAQLASELETPAEIYAADVRDISALQSAATDFMARHGCPDVVIANAGVSTGSLTECAEDIAVFEEVFAINVLGMVKAFHPFVAAMRAVGRGRLAGIASVAGYRGLPGAAAYSASKAAVISYLESLRVELAASGIQVITICPGYVATPMTAQNPYAMPFLLGADAAARKIAALIERGRTYAVIPWQMAVVARLMRVLPDWLYDRIAGSAPRKRRRGGRI